MSAWCREFGGIATTDSVRCAIGACNLTGTFTMAALCRWNDPSEGPDNAIIVNHRTATIPELVLYVEAFPDCPPSLGISGDAGSPSYNIAGTGSFLFEDGWGILVATKTTGTTTARHHLYKNGVWTHANASTGTMGNPDSQATGNIRFGCAGGFIFTPVALAVAAEWNGQALSDGQVETLSNGSTQDWLDLNPAGCWEFGQSSVSMDIEDLTGNGADQNLISGTTATYDPDLVWNYKTSSLPDVSPYLSSYVQTAGRGQ